MLFAKPNRLAACITNIVLHRHYMKRFEECVPPDLNPNAVFFSNTLNHLLPKLVTWHLGKQHNNFRHRQQIERETIIPHPHRVWLRQQSGASLAERTKLIKKGCVSNVSVCVWGGVRLCACVCKCLLPWSSVWDAPETEETPLIKKHAECQPPSPQNSRCAVHYEALLLGGTDELLIKFLHRRFWHMVSTTNNVILHTFIYMLHIFTYTSPVLCFHVVAF